MDKINILEKISYNPETDFIQTLVFDGEKISYRTYLPIDEKIKLATDVVNKSLNNVKYADPGIVKLYKILYFIKYYTNIKIEDLIDTDASNTLDKIITSGLYDALIQDGKMLLDWTEVQIMIDATIDNLYKYSNSALGILEAAAADYENLNFDIEKLQKEISNPESLTVLKDVMTKLG